MFERPLERVKSGHWYSQLSKVLGNEQCYHEAQAYVLAAVLLENPKVIWAKNALLKLQKNQQYAWGILDLYSQVKTNAVAEVLPDLMIAYPDDSRYVAMLHALHVQFSIDKLEACFRKVLQINPHHYAVLRHLAYVSNNSEMRECHPEVSAMASRLLEFSAMVFRNKKGSG